MTHEEELRVQSSESVAQEGTHVTLATGGGKTLSMVALWRHLMEEDDPAEYADTVQVTGEELENKLAAIKRREPTPLPADIEALGAEDQTDGGEAQSRPQPSSWQQRADQEPYQLDLLLTPSHTQLFDGQERTVRPNPAWHEKIRVASAGRPELPRDWFYWRIEQKNRRNHAPLSWPDLTELIFAAWRKTISLRRDPGDWGVGRLREDHASRLLDRLREDYISRLLDRLRDDYTDYLRDIRGYEETPSALPPCLRGREAEGTPEYLLALLVQPGSAPSRPLPPAWFACEDSAVRPLADFTAKPGRWSMVVNVDANVTAGRELAVQAVAMKLPASLNTARSSRQEDIRRLWQTHWRDEVLRQLEQIG